METLFNWLSGALEGSTGLALLAAFGWGMASLVLSPCHLASIPLIIGFVCSDGERRSRSALRHALLFALGILGSIALVGGISLAAGRMLGDLGPFASYAVAALMLAVGLYLADLLPLDWWHKRQLPELRGPLAALLLGLCFGVAVGPCTFAYLMPVLGVVLKVSGTQPALAAGLILAFGTGHCLLIVLAGSSTGAAQRVLDWNEQSPAARWLKRGCGLLVICGAIWMACTA
jgi:cytochrome c-type biogenesis protein